MDVSFNFETSEYYDKPQTTMLVGMGASVIDRLLFNNNFGVNTHLSFIIPVMVSTTIDDPAPEIFTGRYDFLSYIFGVYLGLTYRTGYFFIDFGPSIRCFSMKNSFADYTNFTAGVYINPSYALAVNSVLFEIGLLTGYDLYSDSTIKLKLTNNELKYNGGYNMPYVTLYFGIGSMSKNR
jgi:hypothetical protein